MRIGLFGGSFNPVHLGHMLVVQAAREELDLTRIFLIPAAQSPFKPGQVVAPAPDRLRMLRMALAGQSYCEVDTQEVDRGGISYSIDTVREYRRRYREAELFYLIGADHVVQLPMWRNSAELADLVTFVVIPRPGERWEASSVGFRTVCLEGFPLGISSSQIRRRVKEGKELGWLVPSGVAEVIANNRLYL